MSAAEDFARGIREELSRDTAPKPGALSVLAPTVIALEDVWLSFDSPVLRGIDLYVREGETLLVLGESGTGKSTVLKLILRLLVPDEGRIRIFDEDVTDLSFERMLTVRREVGMVFQNAALFDSLTVFENVAYPLEESTGSGAAEIERIVREKLRFVNLDPDRVMPQLPAELSGGMRKRVAIARAIATDPKVILYDEPTAGLDPLAVDTILNLMRKLQTEMGVTSVLVTHDLRAGFRVASRVNLLRDGKITFDGTPEDMVASADPYIQAYLSLS